MKIFGDPLSTNTRKVLTTLAELQMPFELVHVDFAAGQHKQEAHLLRQPFGQMPALDDDGFILYESHAMCRYLDAQAGSPLMPVDLQGRALVDQWMSIESANFSCHVMKFVYQFLLRMEQGPGVLGQAAGNLDRAVAVLARQLESTAFVAGEAFTLADICYMPCFEYGLLTPAGEQLTRHPSVVAWWSNVRQRPSWRKVVGAATAA